MGDFSFKQFSIKQENCAMKVGTDGVLLGAWAKINTPETKHILDIGTGTGLIALMCAQRANENTIIDAIEIDPSAVQQAKENISNSPFHNKININLSSLQTYLPNYKYQHIVCNPPFFVDSLKCPDKNRNSARHTDTLSFNDLLYHSYRLLDISGILSIIIPTSSLEIFTSISKKYFFSILEITHVYPTPTSPSKRVLISFLKNSSTDIVETNYIKSRITIEKSRHVYTSEYIELTKNYYLKM